MRDQQSSTEIQPTHLRHWGLLAIKGIESKKFLQGQVTCNLDEVADTQSRLGAHCNPQGRVLFLFRIFYFEDTYYFVLPSEMVTHALGFLNKYAVFFKLQLKDATAECPDSLKAKLTQEWEYFNPLLGIPQVYPATIGVFLPHELRLHELDGLSWNKGCYTGQEIIARMHYRGKLKNHLYRAKIQTPALPHPGAELYCTAQQALSPGGTIVDYVQEGYNTYMLVVLASEVNKSTSLKLDPTQNETWEWLN